MSVDNWIAVVADFFLLLEVAGVWVGAYLVVKQLRESGKQQQLQAVAAIHRDSRDILKLGFSNPSLFEVLEDKPGTDPVLERYYLQEWFNTYYEMHLCVKESVLTGELKEGLYRALFSFLSLKNVQRHWETEGAFYSPSFQKLVDDSIKAIKEKEPPPTAATAPPHQAPKT